VTTRYMYNRESLQMQVSIFTMQRFSPSMQILANFNPNQAPISELKLEAVEEFARDNTLFILVISDLHDNFSSWDEEEVQVVSRNFLAGSQHIHVVRRGSAVGVRRC
jgi:hypothetical protein